MISQKDTSDEETELIEQLDTLLDDLIKHLPSEPYIVSSPSDRPFHVPSSQSDIWRRGLEHLFSENEEYLQHQTFFYYPPASSLLRLDLPSSMVTSDSDREASAMANAPTVKQVPKKTMSLAEYKNRKQNKTEGAGNVADQTMKSTEPPPAAAKEASDNDAAKDTTLKDNAKEPDTENQLQKASSSVQASEPSLPDAATAKADSKPEVTISVVNDDQSNDTSPDGFFPSWLQSHQSGSERGLSPTSWDDSLPPSLPSKTGNSQAQAKPKPTVPQKPKPASTKQVSKPADSKPTSQYFQQLLKKSPHLAATKSKTSNIPASASAKKPVTTPQQSAIGKRQLDGAKSGSSPAPAPKRIKTASNTSAAGGSIGSHGRSGSASASGSNNGGNAGSVRPASSPRPGRGSPPPLPKILKKEWQEEFDSFREEGTKLKRRWTETLKAAASEASETKKVYLNNRAAAEGISSILCYMAGFAALDNTTSGVEHWQSMDAFLEQVQDACKDISIISGLFFLARHAICVRTCSKLSTVKPYGPEDSETLSNQLKTIRTCFNSGERYGDAASRRFSAMTRQNMPDSFRRLQLTPVVPLVKPMDVVRFGQHMIKEWAEKEGFKWTWELHEGVSKNL